MRIGVAKEYFDGIGGEVKEALDNAIETYRSLGAEIVELSLPELKIALPVYYILACAEASSNLGRYDSIRYGYRTPHYTDINDMICKTRSEGFGAEVKRRILLGTYVLSSGYYDAYYKKAQNLRGTIIAGFERCFKECDVMLSPTVPMTAFPFGFTGQDPVETYLTDICTVPMNIAGLPAVSIPCGKDGKGMPIGMQLIGDRFAEAKILNAAWQFEQATDFVRQTEWGVQA
jgi:aspartyl-tRNA(Asn)/glutamyl-tRNA(Gln) amidotransferase subunit A